MRRSLTLGLCAIAMVSWPLPALAQNNPNCPPGAWFCEDADVQPPPEVTAPANEPEAQPDADAEPEPDEKPAKRRKKRAPADADAPPQLPPHGRRPHVVVVPPGHPPDVVIIPPPPPPVVVHRVPPPPPPPPPPKRVWRREFGLNLRLEGIAMGQHNGAAHDDAGMGGLGVSFRYRPIPVFALDVGVDLLGGRDYNGFERIETPFSINTLLYVNPRNRVQFYFLGGIHWSHAEVRSETYSPLLDGYGDDGYGYAAEYSYFGGQLGAGLEFRISKRVALNVDFVGFVRSRTDDGPRAEFVDWETGRTSNTSGGGLLRGGITFWW